MIRFFVLYLYWDLFHLAKELWKRKNKSRRWGLESSTFQSELKEFERTRTWGLGD